MKGNNGSDTASSRNKSSEDKSRAKNMHSQTVGERGPVLEQDTVFCMKLWRVLSIRKLSKDRYMLKALVLSVTLRRCIPWRNTLSLAFYKILGSKFRSR